MFYQADVYHSGSYYKFFRQSLETSCFLFGGFKVLL